MITMKLHGLEQLKEQLAELSAVTAGRALARAARKAFLPVVEAAQANAPVDTGLLREQIKVRVVRPKDGDVVVVVGLQVFPAKGAKRLGRETLSPHWRWHFVELGTKFQAARPFIRPALDQNAAGVVSVLQEELAKGIQRALRRQRRSG